MTWQGAVGGIPCAKDMPESWGPSDNDILKAAVLETTASYDESDSEDDGDYNGFGELDEEEDDAELLEVAEESALADAYAQELRRVGDLEVDSRDNLGGSPTKSSSPRKRRRYD